MCLIESSTRIPCRTSASIGALKKLSRSEFWHKSLAGIRSIAIATGSRKIGGVLNSTKFKELRHTLYSGEVTSLDLPLIATGIHSLFCDGGIGRITDQSDRVGSGLRVVIFSILDGLVGFWVKYTMKVEIWWHSVEL